MKKKIGAVLLAVALVVGLAVPMAMPVAASNGSYVLYGIIGGQYLVTVDDSTGNATEIAMLSGDPIGRMGAIAFNPNTGILYGLARGEGSYAPKLTTINMCTGEVTVIGDITLPGQTVYFAEGFAIDPDGRIYVSMSIDGGISGGDYYSETLATVNPGTAVATRVATITGTVQREADGLEFVGSTLYATDDPGRGPTRIYTIDTGTAAATYKGTLSNPRFNNVNDMAYNPDSTLLYGFDPGVYTNVYSRYLCTISQPDAATATAIGITHTAAEFGGGYMSGLAWVSVECGGPQSTAFTTNLCAGQNIEVGNVIVDNVGTDLIVTYEITDLDWIITETHLEVVEDTEDFLTTKKGNPIPGHFTWSGDHDPAVDTFTYTISLAEIGEGVDADDPVYIAAHAVVVKAEQEETAWGGACDDELKGEGIVQPFVEKGNWATYFTYTVQYTVQEEPTLEGEWLLSYVQLPPGGGTYNHDMSIITQNSDGTFSGMGSYPTGPMWNWLVTGMLDGDAVEMTIVYTSDPSPGGLPPNTYFVKLSGSVSLDGDTMIGTAKDYWGYDYTWTATRVP